MRDVTISRRRVLQGVGGAVAVSVATGSASAAQHRHIVGTETFDAVDEARDRAIEIRHVLDFGAIGQAVSGRWEEDDLDELAQRGDVRYIEPVVDYEIEGHTDADQDDGDPDAELVLPWGIDRVDADVAHHHDEEGSGSSVAILDTGIAPDHESLDVHGGVSCLHVEDVDPKECSDDGWEDNHGHGTHCAGTAVAPVTDEGVVGVCLEAELWAVKVLDDDGSGDTDDIAAGIEWTADEGIDVGSMSFGGRFESQVINDACSYAYEQGVLLVSSAGNEGPANNSVTHPATHEDVIAVSAVDEDDDFARWSSRGDEVELAAPGVDILSTVPEDADGIEDEDYEKYAEASGTSMACPHVSGAGAQLMEHSEWADNEEARERLQDTAEDIGLDDNEQGHGLVDVAAALGIVEEEAFFAVEITNTNSPVDEGETLTVDAEIENTGDDEDTQTIELVIDNDEDIGTVDEEEVTLDAGDVTSLTLEWETEDGHAGEYDATVSSDDDSDTEPVTVEDDDDPPDGELSIDTFDVENRSNPRWTRARVTWEVSSGEEDGELETVTSELHDDETVYDEEVSDVSGFEADGEHDLRTDADDLDETDAEVTLTVESETETLSETKSLENSE